MLDGRLLICYVFNPNNRSRIDGRSRVLWVQLMHATTMGTPSGANPHKARSASPCHDPFSRPVSNDTRLPTEGKNREEICYIEQLIRLLASTRESCCMLLDAGFFFFFFYVLLKSRTTRKLLNSDIFSRTKNCKKER